MSTEQNSPQARSKPLGFLFIFSGRIDRVQFLVGLGVVIVLAFGLMVSVARAMDMRGRGDVFILVAFLLLIVIAWIHAAIVVQRVRDAGYPGWYYFIFGPGPFLLLLGAESAPSLRSMAIAIALFLLIGPAFFPRESERRKAN